MGLRIGKFFGSLGRAILKRPVGGMKFSTSPRGAMMGFSQVGSSFSSPFGRTASAPSIADFAKRSTEEAITDVARRPKPRPLPMPGGGGRLGGLAEKIQKGMELMQGIGGLGGVFGVGGASAREHCAMIRSQIAMNLQKRRAPRMRDIKRSAKIMGLETTAMHLGVSVPDLAGLILFCPSRKRPLVRRTDLRACRRVVTSMHRLNSLVANLGVGRTVRRKVGRGRCIRCKSNPCRCPA
jgi:hypothetical protein